MRDIKKVLDAIAAGTIPVEQGLKLLETRHSATLDLGHTLIDLERPARNGFPEIIYGEGKSAEQLSEIFTRMKQHSNIIASRVSRTCAEQVQYHCQQAVYHETARILSWTGFDTTPLPGTVGILAAGTSDLPVMQEAKITCEMLGCQTRLFQDVGVAGLHRLLDRLEEIRKMQVLIVIAGMEGALASVVGGLVSLPIIAIPTSVGYGANFAGLSALLAMITSCAAGITVVNIDNGVGAACAAFRICAATSSVQPPHAGQESADT